VDGRLSKQSVNYCYSGSVREVLGFSGEVN
jgi:hypothetical protein